MQPTKQKMQTEANLKKRRKNTGREKNEGQVKLMSSQKGRESTQTGRRTNTETMKTKDAV